ncbi:hypothetical protein TNCV_2759271 [Trichonephila clavipes]|nr:hypothetical protein TNCV_2759271 [Trichonephila clavipes]
MFLYEHVASALPQAIFLSSISFLLPKLKQKLARTKIMAVLNSLENRTGLVRQKEHLDFVKESLVRAATPAAQDATNDTAFLSEKHCEMFRNVGRRMWNVRRRQRRMDVHR